MNHNDKWFLTILGAAVMLLIARSVYEHDHPLVMHGDKARFVVIPSTGKDIRSKVSYLFGRAPFFIICDRAKGTYKAYTNDLLDAEHAAGLRVSKMLVNKKIDAVCANNIGFEPVKVLGGANIEMYTGISDTVWKTLQNFPDSLNRITEQNVPSHFGITGSKKPVACSSFNAAANIEQVVQGKFMVCMECGFRVSKKKATLNNLNSCPRCGKVIHEVICITAPANPGQNAIKPKVKVF